MIKVLVQPKGWTTVVYDSKTDLSISFNAEECRYQLKARGAEPSDFDITLTDDPHVVYIKRRGEPDKKPREYKPEEWVEEKEKCKATEAVE